MTDDVGADIRARLAALAAAVPVDSSRVVGAAVSPQVRPGSTGRRLTIGWLAPIVVVVIVGTVAAGLTGLGPFAPAATGRNNGPVETTVTDGPFALTIRSAKARYAASEAVVIEATLVYRGIGEVQISHAQGAPVPGRGNVDGPDTGGTGGPLGFGIVEPVLGDLTLAPGWDLSCGPTTLARDIPLAVPFSKSGGFSGSNPRADEYRAYFADPTLRLGSGTWHAYAIAQFSLGGCGGEQHELRAQLAIEVVPTPLPSTQPSIVGEPSATPPALTPEPTPTPDEGVESRSTVGPYALELRAEQRVYHESDVIEITGALSYSGDARSTSRGSSRWCSGSPSPCTASTCTIR